MEHVSWPCRPIRDPGRPTRVPGRPTRDPGRPIRDPDWPTHVPDWPIRVPGWPLRVPLRVEKGVSPGVQKWEPKTIGKIYPTFMSLTVRLKLT